MLQRAWSSKMSAALPIACGAVLLASCVSTPPDYAPREFAAKARFDALAFFTGQSEGRGTLSKVFSKPVAVRVRSVGCVDPGGSLSLVQEVSEGDKTTRTRSWTIREVSPGRYTGALTDATGPVEGESEGNRLTLRYKMEGGFRVKQVLTLSPDGNSASNRLKVSKFGITVAVLGEEIVRLKQAASNDPSCVYP